MPFGSFFKKALGKGAQNLVKQCGGGEQVRQDKEKAGDNNE
jgi:hypothetical protein